MAVATAGAGAEGKRALLESPSAISSFRAADWCAPADANAAASNAPVPEGPETGSALLFAAVGLCCVSPMLFGFCISFTSPTQITMEGDSVGGILPPSRLREFTPNLEKWYASLFNIGAVVGAFSGMAMSERFGRSKTIAFSAIPHLIAWAGTAFTRSWQVLIALRILSGWAVGIGSVVTPCYIAEVSTTRLRGVLGAANQLSITIGIFLVSVLGDYTFVVDYEGQTFSNWRQLSVFGLALSFFLFFMFFMPESPRWLAKTGQAEAVHGNLRRLRSSASIDSEYNGIMSESTRSSTPAGSFAGTSGGRQLAPGALAVAPGCAEEDRANERGGSLLSKYRMSLIVGVGLCMFQQLTGANAVMMYTTKICKQAHMDNAELAAMAAMGAQVIFTAVACGLIERAGRRPLLLFACSSMALSHATLAYYYVAMAHGWWAPSWLALAALGIFILGFSLGMGPVPWLILAELFPTDVRGAASSIAIAVNWSCSFLVCLFFEPLEEAITPQGTFGVFCALSVACFAFVMVLVPETKGKSVDEVLAELSARRSGGIRTAREVPLVAR